MFPRLSKPLLSNSFFMFGARGAGKSTLVQSLMPRATTYSIDLLNPEDDERLRRNPQVLIAEVRGRAEAIEWVLIDEVQKVPALLDVVQLLLENAATRHIKFALTGSSARKLKLAGANLLAGRAYLNELYPLTHLELGSQFDLDAALNWGTLPKLVGLTDDLSKQEYLRTYARVYVKEEIWDERLVHNLDPFRKFIEIAAQTSGTILNYSRVGKQTGVDDKTVKKYFEILVDTFLGFYLEAHHRSVRQQQIKSPKFFVFDLGVKRAMEGLLQVPIVPKTYAFGRSFEQFVISECTRLNAYLRLDYRFSYLKTKDDLEIDLIIERPGQPTAVIEIKSTDQVDASDAAVLHHFKNDFPDGQFFIWSRDPRPKMFGAVRACSWLEGMREVGLSSG